MANSLINGTAGGATPQPEPASDTVPTFGYRGEEAKIFHLKKGEALPDGWVDSPAKIEPAAEAQGGEPAPEAPDTQPRKKRQKAAE